MRELWRDRSFILFLVVVAALLRLDLLLASNFRLDSDEAIVGLMGKHILEGRGVPVFYYGQHYMGSLEAILAAISFTLFGISEVALKLVPLLFGLALIPLVWLLGFALGSRLTARLAALFTAIPSAALVVWSTKARGGFIEVVWIGALAMLCTCRWLRSEPPRLWHTAIIGALLGLGWWTNNQIIFFMLPIAFFMLAALSCNGSFRENLRGILSHFLVGLSAFFIGGAPFWLYNLRNDFVSFQMFTAAEPSGVLDQLSGVFLTALPILFGGKRLWHTEGIFPGSTLLSWIIYGSLILLVVFVRWRSMASLFRLRVDRHTPLELPLLLILSALAIFALSSFGHLYSEPRYLLPTTVGFAVLMGYAIELLAKWRKKVAVVATMLVLSLHLASVYYGGRAIPGEPFVFAGERASVDHSELIAWLKENEIDLVQTNYWIGYRLAFETKEAVRFLVFNEPESVRIAEYEEHEVGVSRENIPLVLVSQQADIVRRALRLLGKNFKEKRLSGYTVIYDIKVPFTDLLPVARGVMKVSASSNNEAAHLAVDGRVDTRWGSAKPQRPGMEFRIRFGEPQRLRGLRIDHGEWHHDYPRRLRVTLRDRNSRRHVLLRKGNIRTLRYYRYRQNDFKFYFRPLEVSEIVLRQSGEHPHFDWSIAEIQPYH